MNRRRTFLIAGAVAALSGCAAATPGVAPLAAAISCAPVSDTMIDAQFVRFTDAWASGHADQVTRLFAPDAVLLATVSNVPRTTPAQIDDYFEHFLAGKPVARIDSSAIRLGCNSAARFGTWTITLTDAASGAMSQVPARYTFLYKFADGQWWIDHLHSSKMPEPGR